MCQKMKSIIKKELDDATKFTLSALIGAGEVYVNTFGSAKTEVGQETKELGKGVSFFQNNPKDVRSLVGNLLVGVVRERQGGCEDFCYVLKEYM